MESLLRVRSSKNNIFQCICRTKKLHFEQSSFLRPNRTNEPFPLRSVEEKGGWAEICENVENEREGGEG